MRAKTDKDYYAVLGVSRDATQNEIQRTYRKLVQQHHPDKHPEAEKSAATKRLAEINEAYEVLSDSDKRAQYGSSGTQYDSHTYSYTPTVKGRYYYYVVAERDKDIAYKNMAVHVPDSCKVVSENFKMKDHAYTGVEREEMSFTVMGVEFDNISMESAKQISQKVSDLLKHPDNKDHGTIGLCGDAENFYPVQRAPNILFDHSSPNFHDSSCSEKNLHIHLKNANQQKKFMGLS